MHQEPQQTERGNHRQRSDGGLMDLRNLCQHLDVERFKSKLPTLPQCMLPKALPNFHGARCIFRSSRENVTSSNDNKSKSNAANATGVAATHASMPQVQFINRTPQRISTISSLMHEHANVGGQDKHHLSPNVATTTYRSAGSLDDNYYAPYGSSNIARVSRPISPVKLTSAAANAAAVTDGGSFSQRLYRGYKSLSELRLKHIFAKQTILRRDDIEVQHYVQQYEAERKMEQMAQTLRDNKIADNYNINIQILPRQRALEQDHDAYYDDEEVPEEQLQDERHQSQAQHQLPHRRSIADHSCDESGMEITPLRLTSPPAIVRKKSGIAASRFAKVRQPPFPMPIEGQHVELEKQQHLEATIEPNQTQVVRQAVRQNLKRLRKSVKRIKHNQQSNPNIEDNDGEDDNRTTKINTTNKTLRARLRRFTSSEQLQQRWRKSFKTNNEGEQNQQQVKQKQQQQKYISNRDLAPGMAAHLKGFINKLNERMQHLKFFQHRQQHQQQTKSNTVGHEPNEIDDEELAGTYHHSDSSSDDDEIEIDNDVDIYADAEADNHSNERVKMGLKHPQNLCMSTAWSSESLEEDGNLEQQSSAADYPRVLIHQQHTDAYESTLIIALATTPPSVEGRGEATANNNASSTTKAATPAVAQWLPNEQIIAGFREHQQHLSNCANWPAPAIYKTKSIDIFEGDGGAAFAFADFDEALCNAPVLRISANSRYDEDIHDAKDDSSSRVTKLSVQSIAKIGNSCESLMEQQAIDDGADDEEEKDEDDKEEKVVEEFGKQQKRRQQQQTNYMIRPPSASPPPPPLPQRRPPTAMAPISDSVPLPQPISKPPTTIASAATLAAIGATAGETTAPPSATAVATANPIVAAAVQVAPMHFPLRSVSITRPAKPLVKTSSLRLTYKEQMHPEDFGKVNKLISRFEGRPRLYPRRMHSEELIIYTAEDIEMTEEVQRQREEDEVQLITPTNVSKPVIPNIITTEPINNNNNSNRSNNKSCNKNNNNMTTATVAVASATHLQFSLERQNSNCSRSEYGSPLSYPTNANSRQRSCTPTAVSGQSIALQEQQQLQRLQTRRNRRSMNRDDDNFYSFDSDEENSYYSISPSSSNRYVVEI